MTRQDSIKIICQNPNAGRLYDLLETYEAGMSLWGGEVKSLRDGKANLRGAHVRIAGGEAFLMNAHISAYPHDWRRTYDPTRSRKLLLKREELKRLAGRLSRGGLTIVPTKLYFRRGYAKAEIALARAKKLWDRREEIKRRDEERRSRREGFRLR